MDNVSAKQAEIPWFEYVSISIQSCYHAGFLRVQSWQCANGRMCAVFGSKGGVLRTSYCRRTYNVYGDTFTWITRLEYAKLQIRWIWLGPDLTRLKPDEALCVWQSMWNIARIDICAMESESRWFEYLSLNIQNCIWAGFCRDQSLRSASELMGNVTTANAEYKAYGIVDICAKEAAKLWMQYLSINNKNYNYAGFCRVQSWHSTDRLIWYHMWSILRIE